MNNLQKNSFFFLSKKQSGSHSTVCYLSKWLNEMIRNRYNENRFFFFVRKVLFVLQMCNLHFYLRLIMYTRTCYGISNEFQQQKICLHRYNNSIAIAVLKKNNYLHMSSIGAVFFVRFLYHSFQNYMWSRFPMRYNKKCAFCKWHPIQHANIWKLQVNFIFIDFFHSNPGWVERGKKKVFFSLFKEMATFTNCT